jgi:hypothetical protein
VPWPPLPLVDPTTDSEPEDSGDPSSPPSLGVSTSPPAESVAHPKICMGSIPDVPQGDQRAHAV